MLVVRGDRFELDRRDSPLVDEEDAQIDVLKAQAKLDAADPKEFEICKAELAKAQRAKDRATRLRKAAGLPDLPKQRNTRGRP